MIGIMLLIAGCNPPTLKEPIDSVFINFNLDSTQHGPVNLDYKKENVGKWANTASVTYGSISELQGTYYCMSAQSFFVKVVPTLIEGHDFYIDHKEFTK